MSGGPKEKRIPEGCGILRVLLLLAVTLFLGQTIVLAFSVPPEFTPGSTVALSDDSGSCIGRFHYDPYGLVTGKQGVTDTIFQFNGHYGIATDPTGLVHLNARFYNPTLKRFMNSDPAGFAGGMNWFAYSAGDPINLFDPLGLGPADSECYTWVDGMQDGIGTLGFIPGLGAIPDGVNGVIYLFRGRIGDSMFSFASAVPLAGDFVAGIKYADKLNDVRRIAEGAEDGGRYVYRGLAEGEDAAAGLFARSPGVGNSEISHVAGKRESQWISTTWDEAVATEKYGQHGVVRIDLNQVGSQVADVSGGFQNGGRMTNYARRDSEVLIRDFIPASAVERIK